MHTIPPRKRIPSQIGALLNGANGAFEDQNDLLSQLERRGL